MSHDFRIIDPKSKETLTTEGLPFIMKYYGGTVRVDENMNVCDIDRFEFNMTYNYSIIIREIPSFKGETIDYLYEKKLIKCKDILTNGIQHLLKKYKGCLYKDVRGDKTYARAIYDFIKYNKDEEDKIKEKFKKYFNKENDTYNLSKIDPSDTFCKEHMNYFIPLYPDKRPELSELKKQLDIKNNYWASTPYNVIYQLNHILECLNWIELYLPKKFSKCYFVGD